jgi:hypothetical protein
MPAAVPALVSTVPRHQVGVLYRGQIGVRGDAEAGTGPDRSAVHAAQRELVEGEAVDPPVGTEDLGDDAQLERRDAVEGEYRHRCDHRYRVDRDWQKIEV